MSTLREVIEAGKLNPNTPEGQPWEEWAEFDLDQKATIVKKADDFTVYEAGDAYLWDGPNFSVFTSRDDGWYGLVLIADQGEGDAHVSLYRDQTDGAIHLSNNAVTKEMVRQEQYAGPGWDTLDVAQWLAELEEEFGSRESAKLFARAALGEDRVEVAE